MFPACDMSPAREAQTGPVSQAGFWNLFEPLPWPCPASEHKCPGFLLPPPRPPAPRLGGTILRCVLHSQRVPGGIAPLAPKRNLWLWTNPFTNTCVSASHGVIVRVKRDGNTTTPHAIYPSTPGKSHFAQCFNCLPFLMLTGTG